MCMKKDAQNLEVTLLETSIYEYKYLARQSNFNMTCKPGTQQQRHTSWVIFQTPQTDFWVNMYTHTHTHTQIPI